MSTSSETITTSPSLNCQEGFLQELERQLREEWQLVNQMKRDKIETMQAEINEFESQQLDITKQDRRGLVKFNVLDALEFITHEIIKLEDPESYLQVREDFLQTLKHSQKLLEKHEQKIFIALLEKQQTDTLRFGKYEITYKLSKKTAIDPEKLKAALPNPKRFSLFLKKPEFKPLPECRRLLLKLGVWSDVYTVKHGKKPILNIIDTNTIRRKVEEAESEEEELEIDEMLS